MAASKMAWKRIRGMEQRAWELMGVKHHGEPMLKEKMIINRKLYSAYCYGYQLTWCPIRNGMEDLSEWVRIRMEDVLKVEILWKDEWSQPSCWSCFKKRPRVVPGRTLKITYVYQKPFSTKIRLGKVYFFHGDKDIIRKWHKMLAQYSEGNLKIKKLLFIVNDTAGKEEGFDLVNIWLWDILNEFDVEYKIITTKGAYKHPTRRLEFFTDEELKEYDCVVAVGGDGTVCEVVNGLLLRRVHTFETEFREAPIPFAIIPSGSTNALAQTLYGTVDPTTILLHILVGNPTPMDVGAIYRNDEFVQYFVGQMSYGFLPDVVRRCENWRCLGPKRYDYSGILRFWENTKYSAKMSISQTEETAHLPASECTGTTRCTQCHVTPQENEPYLERRLEGEFSHVIVGNVSNRCLKSERGIAPFAHISSGCLELILVRHTSRQKHLKFLRQLQQDSRRTYAMGFVERYRIKEMVFFPQATARKERPFGAWNVDGEILENELSINIRVHSGLIKFIGPRTVIPHELRNPRSFDAFTAARGPKRSLSLDDYEDDDEDEEEEEEEPPWTGSLDDMIEEFKRAPYFNSDVVKELYEEHRQREAKKKERRRELGLPEDSYELFLHLQQREEEASSSRTNQRNQQNTTPVPPQVGTTVSLPSLPSGRGTSKKNVKDKPQNNSSK